MYIVVKIPYRPIYVLYTHTQTCVYKTSSPGDRTLRLADRHRLDTVTVHYDDVLVLCISVALSPNVTISS